MTKKDLLEQWNSTYKNYSVSFTSVNEVIDPTKIITRLEQLLNGVSFTDSIYILHIISEEQELTPIYIGRSNAPITRWRSHLSGLIKAKGLYATWRKLLFNEHGSLKHNTKLQVIVDTHLTHSPIPGFPCTIGSVEYQLVSLVSDTYPKSLLNREGNRR